MQRNLFERTMNILYANRLSSLTYQGTMQENVQKIISTEKSVAEMHHMLTNYTYWDPSLTQWLHGILITHLPDDYLSSYIDILEVNDYFYIYFYLLFTFFFSFFY